MRDRIVKGALSAVAAARLQRLAAPRLRGFGAILMLHRVRPARSRDGFAPNDKLEITPDFLDAALTHIRRLGYRPLSLDDALDEVRSGVPRPQAPFVVMTFDDGYRDNLDCALPVLERHAAPAMIYVSTGLADRTARLWWVELEEAVRCTSAFDVRVGHERIRCRAGSLPEKRTAFAILHRALQTIADDDFLAVVGEMGRRVGVDARALIEEACMGWEEIERLAAHPLVTIGAHSITHRRLSNLDDAEMMAELEEPKRELEMRLGRPVRHMAFPYGTATAARPREHQAASRIYDTAVTSCYGLVTGPAMLATGILPRVSVDGRRQDLGCLEVLLSGLPGLVRAGRSRSAEDGSRSAIADMDDPRNRSGHARGHAVAGDDAIVTRRR